MEFKLEKISDWEKVIVDILPQLTNNVLLLKGNLGAGKTTFTQYFLKKIGSSDEVSSPTYSIVNEYHTPKGNVFHFDLYRLNSFEEVEAIGMYEYLQNSFLCIIEWPEIYHEELQFIPHHTLTIANYGDHRKVNFT